MIKIDELRTILVNKKARWAAKANAILALSEAERKLRLGLVVDEQKPLPEAAKESLNPGGECAAAPLVQNVERVDLHVSQEEMPDDKDRRTSNEPRQ